jgi:hypothetical protein
MSFAQSREYNGTIEAIAHTILILVRDPDRLPLELISAG